MTELNRRLKALDNQRGQLPIPKGPLPKGAQDAQGAAQG